MILIMLWCVSIVLEWMIEGGKYIEKCIEYVEFKVRVCIWKKMVNFLFFFMFIVINIVCYF